MNHHRVSKTSSTRKLSILYLEESDFEVENVRATFDGRKFKYDLEHVQNRDEFISAMEGKTFDVILADYLLPSMDGMDVLKAVKDICPNTPVIFIAEKVDEEILKVLIKNGAAEVIQGQQLSLLIPAIKQSLKTVEALSVQNTASQPYEHKVKLYREIVEKSRIPIIHIDTEGYLKYYNKRFVQLFNYKKETLVDFTLKDIVHANDYEQLQKICEACLHGKCLPVRYEFSGIKGDGSLLELEADISEIKINKKLVGVSILMWDVSGRSKMEEVLKQQITIERIISQISADFISLPSENIEQEISRAFDRIKQATKIPESAVYSLSESKVGDEEKKEQEIKSRERILTQLQGTMLDDVFLKALKRKEMEEELRKKEREYESILNSARDCIFAKDLNGKYTYMNPEMAELFDKPASEIIGSTDEDFLDRNTWLKQKKSDARVYNGEIVETEELRENRNEEKTFHIIKVPLRNVLDEVTGLCGVARNITGVKTSDEAFNVGLNILNTLMDHLPDPIFIKDDKGAYVFCNEPCMKMFGAPSGDDILGKTDFDFYNTDYAEKLHKEEQNIIKTGKPIIDSEILDKEGERWKLMTKFPLHDKEHNITGTIGFISNISELKKVEDGVRKINEITNTSMKAAKTGVLTWDRKTDEMYVDPIIREILGVTNDDALKDFDHWMRHVHPDDRKTYLESIRHHLKGDSQELILEYRMMHEDGSVLWFFLRGKAAESGSNNSSTFMGIATDISDLRKREGKLIASTEKFQRIKEVFILKDIASESVEMKKLAQRVHRVAKSDASVLIIGESGTGKELVARNIHRLSDRKNQPFVPIDCVALPPTLLESEIFGYEQGAFTGATKAKPGIIELSNKGTLFLDEITELDINLQAKLLRLIQERKFRSVGGRKEKSVDIRILSATNRDPETAIKENRLREDLYYRINVVPIVIPPLRDRKEDIPMLVYHFIEEYNPTCTIEIKGITKHAMNCLKKYDWPGNVRELQNTIHHAMSLADSDTIDVPDLPENVRGKEAAAAEDLFEHQDFKEAKQKFLDTFTRKYFESLLNKYKGNISKVARIAGVNRKTIYRLYNQIEDK